MKKIGSVLGIFVAAVFLLAVTPAKAADVGEPIVDGPLTFHGGYAGLVSGWGWADAKYEPLLQLQLNGSDSSHNLPGGLAGITAGFNWRAGPVYFGVEGDITTMWFSKTFDCGVVCNHLDLDALATARGRLGWVFGEQERWSVYATGGVAHLWGDHGLHHLQPVANFEETTYVVGVGGEAYLIEGSNWISSKLEYLYVGADLDLGGCRTIRQPCYIIRDDGRLRLKGIHLIRWGWNVHF